MAGFTADRLFELLPSVYRIRDSVGPQPGPLRSLLAVIAEQVGVLEENLDQLYDDQFIETCAEWVVPYIGDLVGTRGVFVFPHAELSARAQVANTIAYRRRKGTAAVLEQLARDVTGWNASVVEYFELLATTQYMNHVRSRNLSLTSVRHRHFEGLAAIKTAALLKGSDDRQWQLVERTTTPFDRMPRTLDVRRIETGRGRHNIPNVGLFLWRLTNYPRSGAPAFRVDDRRYTFDAFGLDARLYNRPESEVEITHLATPDNVPMPLATRILAHSLEDFYGVANPDGSLDPRSLLLFVDHEAVVPDNPALPVSSPVASLRDLIRVCDLRDDGSVFGWAHEPVDRIAIDPQLGRIAFPPTWIPSSVHVSYQYGFSAEIGGGEYGRFDTFFSDLTPVVELTSAQPAGIGAAVNSVGATGGAIEIAGLSTNDYFIENPSLRVAAGKHVELRGEDEHQPILVLTGDMTLFGEDSSELTINGFRICGGRIHVPATDSSGVPNRIQRIRLRHCTVLPGPGDVIAGTSPPGSGVSSSEPVLVVEAPEVIVDIDHSIIGSMRVSSNAEVRIASSIVDAGGETEVAYAGFIPGEPGPPMHVVNSTIIGKVRCRVVQLASNTIFFAALSPGDFWVHPVEAERLQEGCVRFSYVPPGSRVPTMYECQPESLDLAARVRPVFTSLRYGDAGYGQLSPHCAIEIREGADDRAEMGVFHDLYQPQRIGNLRTRLEEYLRVGLEAGVLIAS